VTSDAGHDSSTVIQSNDDIELSQGMLLFNDERREKGLTPEQSLSLDDPFVSRISDLKSDGKFV
jgi:hypothetical protein